MRRVVAKLVRCPCRCYGTLHTEFVEASARHANLSTQRKSKLPQLQRGKSARSFLNETLSFQPPIAILDPQSGEFLRYSECLPKVRQLSHVLRHTYGVNRNSTVTLLLPNSEHFPVALHAAWSLGAAVLASEFPRLHEATLNRDGVVLVITLQHVEQDETFQRSLQNAKEIHPSIVFRVHSVDRPSPTVNLAYGGHDGPLPDDVAFIPQQQRDLPAMIKYTHRDLVEIWNQLRRHVFTENYQPGTDTLLCCAPWSSLQGLLVLHFGLLHAMKLVPLDFEAVTQQRRDELFLQVQPTIAVLNARTTTGWVTGAFPRCAAVPSIRKVLITTGEERWRDELDAVQQFAPTAEIGLGFSLSLLTPPLTWTGFHRTVSILESKKLGVPLPGNHLCCMTPSFDRTEEEPQIEFCESTAVDGELWFSGPALLPLIRAIQDQAAEGEEGMFSTGTIGSLTSEGLEVRCQAIRHSHCRFSVLDFEVVARSHPEVANALCYGVVWRERSQKGLLDHRPEVLLWLKTTSTRSTTEIIQEVRSDLRVQGLHVALSDVKVVTEGGAFDESERSTIRRAAQRAKLRGVDEFAFS